MRPASTHVLLAIVCLTLVAPLLAGFFFSYDRDIAWLVQSGLFLVLAFACVSLLAMRVASHGLRFMLATAIVSPLLLLETLRLVSFYLQGEGFNERFFFHANLNTLEQCWTVYPELSWAGAALVLGFQVLLYVSLRDGAAIDRLRALPLAIPVAAALLLPFIDSAPRDFRAALEQMRSRYASASFIELGELEALGLDAEAIGQSTFKAVPGKNLLFIYLEGIESLYTADEVFPGLTPSLNGLADRGVRFSQLRQVAGTEWTMGGMVASQCGTPLLIDGAANGNDIMHNGFLNDAVCLGDVLAAAGYRQSYLGGARLDFAGKGAFYKAHGFREVFGLLDFRRLGTDADGETWWGLYDEALLARAEEKFRELASIGQPFNLTLLTLDTHAPAGAPSRSCEPYSGARNRMLDAVHCTDQLIGRFLSRLAMHPAMPDTVVVLFSDHRMMRNEADALYPPGHDRNLFFIALNADAHGVRAAPGTSMDVAPTVLDLLGVGHDAAFLAGRSLLTEDQDRTLPDFDDRQLSDRIRWVNTNLLTRKSSRLCDATHLVNYEAPAHLAIGERRIALVHEGWPERFRTDFAAGNAFVLAFIDADGIVGDVATVRGGALSGLIQQHPDDVYLLITARNAVQRALPELAEGGDEVYVALGRPGGKTEMLGGFPTLEDVAIGVDGCEQRLEAVRASLEGRAGPS